MQSLSDHGILAVSSSVSYIYKPHFTANIMKTVTTVILFLALSIATADTLKPFKSDGCSAFPDGTLAEKDLWLRCCYQHDLSYWQGGTAVQRKQADFALKYCVAQVGEPMVANLMLAGVRVGGSPYWPTQFRWAYGWPYFRGYKEISAEEQKQIDAELSQIKPLKTD
ncbi:hypothetical protein [Marinicella litoralis]|uniref:Uncharacterized protein n=1 Tax=Marinicella litoralis TaxID=644220 RepID=A0A4R6XRL9_9GAMM|nr:hypothetical protein [Marinicella litoralis]TDR22545.1 hypothetical protein C8D91_1036 [Marinicella litoralis]